MGPEASTTGNPGDRHRKRWALVSATPFLILIVNLFSWMPTYLAWQQGHQSYVPFVVAMFEVVLEAHRAGRRLAAVDDDGARLVGHLQDHETAAALVDKILAEKTVCRANDYCADTYEQAEKLRKKLR